MTMKAVHVYQYGGPEELRIEEAERPQPAAGQVLIRVRATGVLPVDWKIREGWFKESRNLTFPYIPGSAVAGIVEETGSGVTELEPGQAVFGRSSGGAYAEFVTSSPDLLVPKPEAISFAEGATIGAGATTAWQAMMIDASVEEGDKVLIHGASGGVGLFATQIAHWRGAHVTGTASADNLDFVRSLGADEVIDYRRTRFEDVVQDVDFILDTVSGETLERSWSVLGRGGTLISLNDPPSQEKARALDAQAQMPGHSLGRQDLLQIRDLMASGKLKGVIQTTFPLDEVRQATELCQTGHGRGRIILEIT